MSASTTSPTSNLSRNSTPSSSSTTPSLGGAYFIPASVPFHFPVGHPLRRLSHLSPDAQIGFKISFPHLVLSKSQPNNKNEETKHEDNNNSSNPFASNLTSIFSNLRGTSINNNNNTKNRIGTTSLPTTPPLSATSNNNNDTNAQIAKHVDCNNITINVSSQFLVSDNTQNSGMPEATNSFDAIIFNQQQQPLDASSSSSPTSTLNTACPTPTSFSTHQPLTTRITITPTTIVTLSTSVNENQQQQQQQQFASTSPVFQCNNSYWLSEFQRLFLDAPNKIEPSSFTSTQPYSSKTRDQDFLAFAVEKLSHPDVVVSSIQHWYLAARFTNDLDLMIQILKCKTIGEALDFLRHQETLSRRRKTQELDEELSFANLMKLGRGFVVGDDDDEDSNSSSSSSSSSSNNNNEFWNVNNTDKKKKKGKKNQPQQHLEATSDLLFGGFGAVSDQNNNNMPTTSTLNNNNSNQDNNNNNNNNNPKNDGFHRIIPIERDSRWSSPSHRRRVFRFGLWCAFIGTGILLTFHENRLEEQKQKKQEEAEKEAAAALLASGKKPSKKSDKMLQKEKEKLAQDKLATTTFVPLHIQLLIETQKHPLFLRSKPIWNNRQEEEEGSYSSSWTAWYGEDLSLLRDFDIPRLLPSAFSSNSSSSNKNVLTHEENKVDEPKKKHDDGDDDDNDSEKKKNIVIDETHEIENYVITRPLVSVPMIFLLSTCEEEDYIVPEISHATRIADLVLPPPKILALQIRARLFSERLLPNPSSCSSVQGSNNNNNNKNNNSSTASINSSLDTSDLHQDDISLISDHLPSSLNILKGLFQNTTNLLLCFDSSNHHHHHNLQQQQQQHHNGSPRQQQQHNHNQNHQSLSSATTTTTTTLLPTIASSIITPSFIYSLLLDCYSSPAASAAVEVLLSTEGKRLVVLGSDPLLADGGHLEFTGFAEANSTALDLVSLTTDEITKELQNRRGVCRGGNLLGRILELVRQDLKEQQQQQQQQQNNNNVANNSSTTTTTTTTATPAPSGGGIIKTASFLAGAAPKISRRRLAREAFSTKLLLRSHAFEFKLQNLSALIRPLDFWWTQQLGAFCGLKPALLSNQLATFAKALVDHEDEQESLNINTSFGGAAPTNNNNTKEKKLSLDQMISAAASSSRGPVCCAICVSVPIPHIDKKMKKWIKAQTKTSTGPTATTTTTTTTTIITPQQQEEIFIKSQLREWEAALRVESNYSSLPSWCFSAEIDDIVITTSASNKTTNHNDVFLENLPPSFLATEQQLQQPLQQISIVENSSYFSLAQTNLDDYNSNAQSQEFFSWKKSNENDNNNNYSNNGDDNNNNNNNTASVMSNRTSSSNTSNNAMMMMISPSSNVTGRNQVFGNTPPNINNNTSSKMMRLATFVFYIRFDSFDNHSMDQMNLEAHLFAFKIAKDDILAPSPPLNEKNVATIANTTTNQQVKTENPSSPISSSIFTIQVQNNIRARSLSSGVRIRVFFGALSFQRIVERLHAAKKQENALMCALMTIPTEKEQEEQRQQQKNSTNNNNNLNVASTSTPPIINNNSNNISSGNPASLLNSSSSSSTKSKNGGAGAEMAGAKMSKLLSFLYLGSANDASSSAILKEGITHVLNASHVRVFSPSNTLVTVFLGIPDVGDRALFDIKSIFPSAFNFIDNIQKMHDEAMSAIVAGGGGDASVTSSSTIATSGTGGASASATSSSGVVSGSGANTKTLSNTIGGPAASLFTVTRTTKGGNSSALANAPPLLTGTTSNAGGAANALIAGSGGVGSINASASSSSSTPTIVVPKILVHCEKGKSRSAAIVTAYLMRLNGWTVGEALHYIRQRRPFVEPNLGFLESLKEYEREIAAERALKRRATAVLLGNPAQSLSKVQILKAMQLLGVEEVVDCSDRIAGDGTRRVLCQFASPGGANRALVAARALSAKMLVLGGRVWLTDFDEFLHAIKTGRA